MFRLTCWPLFHPDRTILPSGSDNVKTYDNELDQTQRMQDASEQSSIVFAVMTLPAARKQWVRQGGALSRVVAPDVVVVAVEDRLEREARRDDDDRDDGG